MRECQVANLHALFPIPFRAPGGEGLTLEFVVDTGFTGYLTLPEQAAHLLELPLLHRIPADLADGSTIDVPVYLANVEWRGESRSVTVLATGERPLLGTALLSGLELRIEFIEAGRVRLCDL